MTPARCLAGCPSESCLHQTTARALCALCTPGLESGARPGHTRPPWLPVLGSLHLRILVPSPFPLHPRAGSPTGLLAAPTPVHAADKPGSVPNAVLVAALRLPQRHANGRGHRPPPGSTKQCQADPRSRSPSKGPESPGPKPASRAQRTARSPLAGSSPRLPSPARKPRPSEASLTSQPGASALPFTGLPETRLHTTRVPAGLSRGRALAKEGSASHTAPPQAPGTRRHTARRLASANT